MKQQRTEVLELDRGSHPVTRLNESAVAVHVTSRITVVSDRQFIGIECLEYCALTEQTRLAIVWKQVVINPKTQADVWVHEKVDNCTTRYMCVLVDTAFGKRYLYNTTYRIDDHTLNAVGCTARNVDEHRNK